MIGEEASCLIKLETARKELKTAGPIHSRDLQKYIRRLEKELMKQNSPFKKKEAYHHEHIGKYPQGTHLNPRGAACP